MELHQRAPWDHASTSRLDHGELLTLARRAHAAAADADPKRLAGDLATLAHALSGHLSREVPLLARLAPAEARLLRRGQARVSAAARGLLEEAMSNCGEHRGRCADRAEELVALFVLQTQDERRAFHGSCAPRKEEG